MDTRTVTVYGKQVEIREKAVQIYEKLLNEPFNDMVALYMAESYGGTKDMPEEELAYRIEQNIIEHVSIYEGACKAISSLERKDGEIIVPELD